MYWQDFIRSIEVRVARFDTNYVPITRHSTSPLPLRFLSLSLYNFGAMY